MLKLDLSKHLNGTPSQGSGMKTDTLNAIGLNNSEIKVYFALLELESSTVGPIIDKAVVPDSKIYLILRKLKEKGLVSIVIKNNIKHFQALNPKNLTRILEEKSREIEIQKQELENNIIPQIELRRKLTQDKQEAIVYESLNGLKSAFLYLLDTLQKGEEYQVLMFGEDLGSKTSVGFFREHHKRRMNKGIKVRLISELKNKKAIQKGHPFIVEFTRYTKQKFPVGIYIFKNHIMTVLWSKRKTAFVIKSKDNYSSYKEFFEELWRSAKPL